MVSHSLLKFVSEIIAKWPPSLAFRYLEKYMLGSKVEVLNPKEIYKAVLTMDADKQQKFINETIKRFGMDINVTRFILVADLGYGSLGEALEHLKTNENVQPFIDNYIRIYDPKRKDIKSYIKFRAIYPIYEENELRVYGAYSKGTGYAYTAKELKRVKVLRHRKFTLSIFFNYSPPVIIFMAKRTEEGRVKTLVHRILADLGFDTFSVRVPKVFIKNVMNNLVQWCSVGYAAIEVRSQNLGKLTYAGRRRARHMTNIMNDPEAKRKILDAIEKENLYRASMEVSLENERKNLFLPYDNVYFSVYLKGIPRIRLVNFVDEITARLYALNKVLNLIMGGPLELRKEKTILDYLGLVKGI